MSETLGGLIGELLDEAAEAVPGPLRAVGRAALKAMLKRRLEAAREIALEEIRVGDRSLWEAEPDEVVAIVYRYLRAAQEGAARINLRLLARVIAGQAHMGNLKADEFLYYADILASLRREEIIALAKIHHLDLQMSAASPPDKKALCDAFEKELVPSIFSSQDELLATCMGVTRTGLVLEQTDYMLFDYRASPLLHRLVALAPFEGLGDGSKP